MFKDLNWDAFLEVIKNCSKHKLEDCSYDDEIGSEIESDIKDKIDDILNPPCDE